MKRIPMILAAAFITSSCSMSDEAVAVQWGLRYYYEFIDDLIMAHHAAVLRRERVEQTPFKLRDSRGIDMDVTDRLARCDVRTVDDLHRAGVTAPQRADLADRAGIPLESLDELIRLVDLSRIGASRASAPASTSTPVSVLSPTSRRGTPRNSSITCADSFARRVSRA